MPCRMADASVRWLEGLLERAGVEEVVVVVVVDGPVEAEVRCLGGIVGGGVVWLDTFGVEVVACLIRMELEAR